MGIRVKAGSLKTVFKNLARAMFDIIAQRKKTKLAGLRKIKIKESGQTREELLVKWLNELLSLSSAKRFIFRNFKIDKLEENKIIATVTAAGIENYKVNKEIKAATYHELKIRKVGSGWEAEVIFDV